MALWGLKVGSWADLLAAFGTIGAVIFAIKNRTDRAKIQIFATYIEYTEYGYDPIGIKKNFYGESIPIFDDKTNGTIDNMITNLKIYFINTRQSGGIVASWGIIDSKGKKIEISSEPIFVKGFDIVQIKRHIELAPEQDYDFVIDKIDKIVKKNSKFKIYFKDIRGKTKYCIVKKQTRSNELR